MPHQDISESAPAWLELPPRKRFRDPGPSAKYGAAHVAARYCGLKTRRFTADTFVWTHGWRPDHSATIDPNFTASISLHQESRTILVARELEASYLHEHGYTNAQAIGMPICYTQPPAVKRQPGSLLVVPVHSLETTQHQWPFQEYADLIADAASDFDDVVVCLHPSCIKNGYWINEFESRNLPWVSGADVNDANSLDRMRYLCSQFEYVTTNGLTSTIAYASADGAKVSIFGPFCEIRVSDVEEVLFYQQNPGLAQRVLPQLQENAIRRHLADFFCHPANATDTHEWGRRQLGYDAVLPPDDLRELLFAPPDASPRTVASKDRAAGSRLWDRSLKILRAKAKSPSPSDIDDPEAADRSRPPLRDDEVRRLLELQPGQPGTVTIHEQTFSFTDGELFVKEYTEIFDNNSLLFPSIYVDPLIIHRGAGIGVAERFWLTRFPAARIIAFESDPAKLSLLRQNLGMYENAQIVIHDSSSWPGLTGLVDDDIEFIAANLDSDASIEEFTGATDLLARARRLSVTYGAHVDRPQRLSEILAALERSGFRYHVVPVPQSVSPRPLVHLKAVDGVDLNLNIWAYRGARFPRTRETGNPRTSPEPPA